MDLHRKAISEEIAYYRLRNNELAAEDVLREIFGKEKRNQEIIAQNQARIDRLHDALLDLMI